MDPITTIAIGLAALGACSAASDGINAKKIKDGERKIEALETELRIVESAGLLSVLGATASVVLMSNSLKKMNEQINTKADRRELVDLHNAMYNAMLHK